MTQTDNDDTSRQERVVQEIIELQREFYFENKDKVSERRRRLREIIEKTKRVVRFSNTTDRHLSSASMAMSV